MRFCVVTYWRAITSHTDCKAYLYICFTVCENVALFIVTALLLPLFRLELQYVTFTIIINSNAIAPL